MIIVHDNRKICSHAAECVKNLPSVFRLNTKAWIDPDAATAEKVIDTIRKCPSGALSYSIDGNEYRDFVMVHICKSTSTIKRTN
jgi:uncharacterized Fe-S cluster protein YjdI